MDSINGLTIGKANGSDNTAIGEDALKSNSNGDRNTAIGHKTLYGNATGNDNTGIGYNTFGNQSDTDLSGSYNTGIGSEVMRYHKSGNNNTGIGYNALTHSYDCSSNTAIGSETMTVQPGNDNTSVGYKALHKIGGSHNTSVGGESLVVSTSSSYNTAIGNGAGKHVTSNSDYNTFVGVDTGIVSGNNYSHSTALGYGATVTADNQIMLGRSDETVVVPGDASFNGNLYVKDIFNTENSVTTTTTTTALTSPTQLGNEIDGAAAGDYFGRSISLSSDGTILAIGAPYHDTDNTTDGRGHVRVYQYTVNNGWTQLGADIDGAEAYDEFGSSVSLSSDGTILAIGAPWHDADNTSDFRGHVQVYQYTDSGGWTQLGTDIDGAKASDTFGTSVSLSSDGTIVAIGAPWHDTDNTNDNKGHVWVY